LRFVFRYFRAVTVTYQNAPTLFSSSCREPLHLCQVRPKLFIIWTPHHPSHLMQAGAGSLRNCGIRLHIDSIRATARAVPQFVAIRANLHKIITSWQCNSYRFSLYKQTARTLASSASSDRHTVLQQISLFYTSSTCYVTVLAQFVNLSVFLKRTHLLPFYLAQQHPRRTGPPHSRGF